jgi:hypothetical protein
MELEVRTLRLGRRSGVKIFVTIGHKSQKRRRGRRGSFANSATPKPARPNAFRSVKARAPIKRSGWPLEKESARRGGSAGASGEEAC